MLRRGGATMFSASVLADARHPGEQRRRGGVDVDADGVDAVLDHRVERAGQLRLGDVVLVLADADRLGVDLHQLGQRVLQPAGDRHRAPQRDVEVGQLLRRRRPRPSTPTRRPPTPRSWSGRGPGGSLISSPASLSVSREAVPLPMATSSTPNATGQPGQRSIDSSHCRRRLVRVDRVGGHAPCRCASTTATFTPVRSPGSRPIVARRAGRRGQQQVAQVGGEDPHRLVLRLPGAAACGGRCRGGRGSRRPPGPAHGVDQPVVGRAGPARRRRSSAAMRRSNQFGPAAIAATGSSTISGSRVRSRTSSFSPRNTARIRCDGQLGERLGEVEVVGELGARLLLALAHARRQPAALPTSAPAARRSGRRPRRSARRGWPGPRPARPRRRRRPSRRRRSRRRSPAGRASGRRAARRPAAPAPPRGRSAPWCGASACRAGRCPPGGPWSRRP